jgi:hypothetical protein
MIYCTRSEHLTKTIPALSVNLTRRTFHTIFLTDTLLVLMAHFDVPFIRNCVLDFLSERWARRSIFALQSIFITLDIVSMNTGMLRTVYRIRHSFLWV